MSLPRARVRLGVWMLVLASVLLAGQTCAAEPMYRLDVAGRSLEGTPVAWWDDKVYLLARDGQVVDFDPKQVGTFGEVPGGFRSYSQAEIRGLLMREFGQGYEVSGVGHYLVVHPVGRRDAWAPRFEELYRSFVHYFSARGWTLPEPRFPLVAVVYAREADFLRHARREGLTANSGLLGYYSQMTNRILMFDSTAGNSGENWSQNAETIIHEAAHQSAFNTGVHSRFGVEPRWVVEGLGTMFEAPGVWQSRTYPHLADRINRAQLEHYRRYVRSRRPADAIAQLVSSDRPFQANALDAYAESWALSFFLLESEPKKYFQYLAKTAAVTPFSDYRSPQRLKDFTDAFGTDLKMLDARLQRFIGGLK